MVQQLALGTAFGLAVHEVDADYSRNPTIAARESTKEGKQGAILRVTLEGGPEAKAPVAQASLATGDGDCLLLRLSAPARGCAWRVTVGGAELPRWNLPAFHPDSAGIAFLRDVPLTAGREVPVVVEVLDRLGRPGPATRLKATPPDRTPPALGKISVPIPADPPAGLTVIPILDAVTLEGKPLGAWPTDHRRANEVWNGGRISLKAAAGELVGFQVLIDRPGSYPVSVDLPGVTTRIHRLLPVDTPAGKVGDPMIPCATVTVAAGTTEALVIEVQIPFTGAATPIAGRCRIGDTDLPIHLELRPFALPRRCRFLCEMNTYGLPDSVADLVALEREAYLRRCHVNPLHYPHRTAAADSRRCNLDLRLPDGRRMDEQRYNSIAPGAQARGWWDDFATAFGPMFDGSVFANDVRGAVPAPGFYLTFHESWPLPLRPWWNGDLDAFAAFDKQTYRDTYVAVLRDFVAEAKRRGWTEAGFQVYLNNKGDPKDPQKGPWILDEPTSWWDYRALAYYGALTREATGGPTASPVDFRIDISRPEFTRGQLDGVADLWVVSGDAFRHHLRLVQDRRFTSGERLWEYGTTCAVDEPPRQTWAWVLDAFRRGADGVVPWQTVNRDGQALHTGDALGLFVFDTSGGSLAIRPSRRLHAYVRAEQDIEYLLLLAERQALTRAQLATLIANTLHFSSEQRKENEADAGIAIFRDLDPEQAWRLREGVAALITPLR